MASIKSIAIGVALVGGAVGLLFGSGVVSLKKRDASANEDPELESLSYLNTPQMPARERSKQGVTVHKPAAEKDGLGIATPIGSGMEFKELAKRGVNDALRFTRLVDMEGREVHRWSGPEGHGNSSMPGWANAKVADDGSLIAIDNRAAVMKLDWDSNVVWLTEGWFHHDLAIRDDGGIVILEERLLELEDEGEPYHLLDDGFTWIDAEGNVERRIWMHEALADEPFYKKHIAKRNARWRDGRRQRMEAQKSIGISCGFSEPVLQRADFIHANSVHILDRDIEGVGRKGDILTALREMHRIAVFSAEDGSLLWSWGEGKLDRPHDPDLLASGRFLVFDNGWSRGWSRLVEVDPKTRRISWHYKGPKGNKLWSKKRGLTQELSNRHLIANASQGGRVIELNRKGSIAWEYFSPDILGDYRVPMRYIRLGGPARDAVRSLLEERGGNPGKPIAADP